MCESAGAREPKEVGRMGVICRKLLVPLESFLVLDIIKDCYCSHGPKQQSHSSCERDEAIAEGKVMVWKNHLSPFFIDREDMQVLELLSQLIMDRIQIYCCISSLFHTIFGISSEFISCHSWTIPRLLNL